MGVNDETVFVSVSYILKPILSKNVYPFWHLCRVSYCYQGDCMYTFPGNKNTCVELLMTKKVTFLKDNKLNLWVVQCMKMYIIFHHRSKWFDQNGMEWKNLIWDAMEFSLAGFTIRVPSQLKSQMVSMWCRYHWLVSMVSMVSGWHEVTGV